MWIRTSVILAMLTLGSFINAAGATDLHGAWQAENYIMKGGQIIYPVRGLIIFSDKDFAELFLTIKDGVVVRGSGEGGFYETSGDKLILFHRFFTGPAFAAIPGLKAQEPEAEFNDPPKREEATYRIEGDRLTISFGPSGNKLTWIRSSK
jgi:hypothetical protein